MGSTISPPDSTIGPPDSTIGPPDSTISPPDSTNDPPLQNNINRNKNTTFVSIIFDEWTEEMAKYITFWGSCEIPIYLYVCEESFGKVNDFLLSNTFNIKLHPEFYHYQNTWAYQQHISQIDNVLLPLYRNTKKDTETFLWNGHAKVEYMAKTIEINPFDTTMYAWFDFHMPSVFRKDPSFVRDYLKEYYSNITYPLDSPLFIPGCISTKYSEEKRLEDDGKLYNNVNWRFCGSFFVGSIHAITEFWELYNLFFIEFLQETQTLTWEVNFWMWLESVGMESVGMESKWNVHWYYSDHCETMLQLPEDPHLCILKKSIRSQSNYQSHKYDYFPIKQYRPTSASYVYFKNRHWLNTRYVNYFLTPSGRYTFPDSNDSTIRNKNICCELSVSGSFYPITFLEMETNSRSLGVPFHHGFSEGIEDIRLYVFRDEIRFIGTTLSYSNEKDKLRIIRGTYDICLGILSNGCVITPPTDTYCEKNWIPLIDEQEQEYFIYKWCPMEIGTVVENETDKTKSLMIVKKYQTNPFIFSKVRGSTHFIPFSKTSGLNYLIGLVHYSEETVPRQYYHRLVLLDKSTFEIKWYSDSFCFEKIGVEFCIGFTILNSTFVFWISQMDRDPLMTEININYFDDKWHMA